MTDPDDFEPAPDDEPQPITRPARKGRGQSATPLPSSPPDRSPPHSAEAEEHVIACCLLEGDNGLTLKRALEAGITDDSFYDPKNRLIFSILRTLPAPSLEILAAELTTRRKLDAVGGYPYLLQITGKIPTTAHASYFIAKLRELHVRRELIRSATRIVEQTYNGADLSELKLLADFTSKELAKDGASISLTGRALGTFNLPGKGDPSILIGNRWLSRGDIFILASTSGMGKSSLSIQAAVSWALGLPLFGGFHPARPLKSMMFQAEDGEGDIAEVRLSMEHAMQLTPDQKAQVDANVIIVTDRIHRGLSFRAELKRQIELHSPDIVWINPLLAFIGGDVNDSTDVGQFLREQLNSLNEPARFAYAIVHHTAKPPKEKKERQWNEVMYEMAGSADLTNAARAILSLQATGTEGTFKLVAAKRGQRAGLTHLVPGVVNPSIKFEHPTSTIMVRHSKDRFTHNGSELPVIHWERCEEDVEEFQKKAGGRPPKYALKDLIRWVPKTAKTAKPVQQIFRDAEPYVEFSLVAAKGILIRAHAAGEVMTVDRIGLGPCYHLPELA